MTIKELLSLAFMLVCVNEAHAQAGAAAPSPPSRTMASLFAEGFEIQTVRVFQDKIWLRKPDGDGAAFICDRGKIGSANFEAYRNRNYDQVPCSPAP
jgi:hypothetical protein